MAHTDPIETFNECINRLQAGQTIEDCLRAHPLDAAWLRPQLEAGLAVARAKPTVTAAAKERVRARVMAAAAVQPRRRLIDQPLGWRRRLLAASLLIAAVGILAVLFSQANNEKRLHVEPLTPTVSETITPTATESPTPSIPTWTPTPIHMTPTPSSSSEHPMHDSTSAPMPMQGEHSGEDSGHHMMEE